MVFHIIFQSSYNSQILERLPYHIISTNFHYHGQVNSKVKLIQNPKSTLTINPISQFIVHREHGIMIEIISLNPIYSEPCRHTQHLYSTRITYLNPNLVSNENPYMFPQVIYVISTVSYQYPMAKLNPKTSKNFILRP